VLETGIMGFGKNPCFKRKSRGKGSDGDEKFVLGDDTMFLLELLSNDIAEDTPVFIMEIGFGPCNLFAHPFRDNGEGDDLGMGMFQRGPCCDAMVFEDEDVSEARVAPQIDDPLTVRQQDILCTLEGQVGQSLFMPRRFDHDFMGANPIHLVIDPFPFSVQFSFYSEGGELIGNDAKGPTGRVRRGSIVSECNNLRRGSIFIPFAQGAEPTH
jgi:hypothetical protein